MTLSPVISVSWKPLNCCRAIIGSPACMHMSSPMSLPAIPVPTANPRVTFNMVSSRHCPHPLVPGNRSHAILSLIYPFRMGMILSLSSSTASRRCVTLSLVSKLLTRPSSHVYSSITSFACTASLILLSLTVDRFLRLIFGNLLHPWWIWNVDYLLLSTLRLMVKLNVWIKPSNNIFISIAIINRIIGRISCLSQNSQYNNAHQSMIDCSPFYANYQFSSQVHDQPTFSFYVRPCRQSPHRDSPVSS